MQLIHTIPVSANGKHYEIRVFADDADYSVAGYHNDRQVTAGYGVKMVTDFDFHQYHGTWAHDHLVTAVKEDIMRGHVAP